MFKIRLLVLLNLVISNKIFSSDASKMIEIYLIEITEDDVNKVERCVKKFKKGDHSELEEAISKSYFYDKYISDKNYSGYVSFLIKENSNMPNSYAQFLEMVKRKLSLDTFYIYGISDNYDLGISMGTISGSPYGLNSYKNLCKNGWGFHQIIDSDMRCNLINTLKLLIKKNSAKLFIFYSRNQIIENSVKTQNGKKNKKCCCC